MSDLIVKANSRLEIPIFSWRAKRTSILNDLFLDYTVPDTYLAAYPSFKEYWLLFIILKIFLVGIS